MHFPCPQHAIDLAGLCLEAATAVGHLALYPGENVAPSSRQHAEEFAGCLDCSLCNEASPSRR